MPSWMLIVAASLGGAWQQELEQTTISNLVRHLGDAEFAVREAAGAALERLGERALPPLRAAAQSHDDAEVRARATAILRAADVPDLSLAAVIIDWGPAELEFLRGIRGKSRRDVLARFGHPYEASWDSRGSECWTYYRPDAHAIRVYFRHGIAGGGWTPEDFGGVRYKY